MKVDELRIGNWVECKEYAKVNKPEIFQITTETFHYQYRSSFISKYVEPILLTEEWLLKFGFEKDDTIWIKHPIYGLLEKNGRFFIELGETGGIYIKYVHQLQNLYFALTGEELTIKE